MSHTVGVARSVSGVGERLIAALVPGPIDKRPVLPVRLPTLPTLRPSPGAAAAAGLVVATARMDGSGRVHERLLLRVLGWEPGHQVEMDTCHGLIVLAAASTGRYVIDARGAFTVPASMRHLCDFRAGEPIVLAAAVHEQLLVVHPAVVVAGLLAAHYRDLLGAR